MPDSEHKGVIQARALPLGELQRQLQRAGDDALTGDPESILRSLQPGQGGVVRLPRESTADILAVRNAFRNAAAKLRPEHGDRGLLATASRDEGSLVAIYFWYTGDVASESVSEAAHPPPPSSSSPALPGPTLRIVPSGETATRQEPSQTSTPPAADTPAEGVAQPAPVQEWSLPNAAATLGVSVKTIRRAIKSGKVSARLVQGPRGPEYRVDIRPMLRDGSAATQAHPPLRVAPPRPSPGHAGGRSPAGNVETTLRRLLERLDFLESEVGKLMKGE